MSTPRYQEPSFAKADKFVKEMPSVWVWSVNMLLATRYFFTSCYCFIDNSAICVTPFLKHSTLKLHSNSICQVFKQFCVGTVQPTLHIWFYFANTRMRVCSNFSNLQACVILSWDIDRAATVQPCCLSVIGETPEVERCIKVAQAVPAERGSCSQGFAVPE